MKISFIITTKNEERYIKHVLLAIKNFFKDYDKEIIVVDSYSTDSTVDIAKKYCDKVIVQESNIPEGKNIGAKYSTGNILAFLNADVILKKEWINKVYGILKNEKIIGVCSLIEARERTLKARIFTSLWNLVITVFFLIRFPHTSGETTLTVKKEYFEYVKGFREDLTAFEDIDLGLRLSKLGKIHLIREKLCIASLRRFEKEGYFKWSIIWIMIGLYYLFTKKPLLKKYPLVR